MPVFDPDPIASDVSLAVMRLPRKYLDVILLYYFNTFAQLEASLGQYTSRPASAKVELVQAMENSGLSIDGEKAERMNYG